LIRASELAGDALAALKTGDVALGRARIWESRKTVLDTLNHVHESDEPAAPEVSVATTAKLCPELRRLLTQLQHGENT
jgi:hypothetical protein